VTKFLKGRALMYYKSLKLFYWVWWLTRVILGKDEVDCYSNPALYQTQPWQKVHEPSPQPIKLGMAAHTYHPSYAGSKNRGIMVQDKPTLM
jgi:hypothetical protein